MATFQIGDRVRVMVDRRGKPQTGEVLGPLIQVSPKEEYFIAFDGGGSDWFPAEHIERFLDGPSGISTESGR